MLSELMMVGNIVAFLISLLIGGPSFRPVSVQTANKALKVSVLLRMKTVADDKGMRTSYGCSGTYVTPTRILTAAHCFTDKLPLEFVWARGPSDKVGYPVRVIKILAEKDLALLEAPYPRAYARLGPTPRVGQPVMNVGSPMMFEFVVSDGIIAALRHRVRGMNLTAYYTVTTAMINPGSSGGGMFDERGNLIGVNTMAIGMFGWAGISLAVSIEDVRAFLR